MPRISKLQINYNAKMLTRLHMKVIQDYIGLKVDW